jgi:hypothetical protein
MLESRQFDERHKIKAIIENDYLTRFYGDDEKTRTYVKSLLLNNFKHAAIEINKHVLVMGNSIKYKQIYPKIEKIFPEAKLCRLPIEVQPRLRLRRLNNIRLDNLISKIETQEIWNTETIELFEAIFNTEVEPIGSGEERTYIFTLNSRKYNQDLNYLKNKIIEHLDVDN